MPPMSRCRAIESASICIMVATTSPMPGDLPARWRGSAARTWRRTTPARPTYNRRYRPAQSATEAAKKLMNGRGTQFDPNLVDLFLSPPVFDEIIGAMRADHAPQPRAAQSGASKRDAGMPELSFRWRTTTPAPRALGRKLRKSP